MAHGVGLRGREGVWLFGGLFVLGWMRETCVALWDILYGFAPLTLMLGKAPLLAAIIWGYSIYIALVWAEEVTGETLSGPRFPWRLMLAVALFMVALAGFYEPLLKLVDMARWEAGTRATLGVPWIALVGYPTLATGFLLAHRGVHKRFERPLPRGAALVLALSGLAGLHAWGLKGLKVAWGW